MKSFIISFLLFLAIDFVWIALVVNKQYKTLLSKELLLETPNLIPAILFYCIFCVGLWFLVISQYSGDMKETLLRAAVFGIVTYATYTLTNLSILRGWNSTVAVSDILWGGSLSAMVTYFTLLITGGGR